MSLAIAYKKDNETGIAFLSCARLGREDHWTFWEDNNLYHCQGFVLGGDYTPGVVKYNLTGNIENVTAAGSRQFMSIGKKPMAFTGAALRHTFEYKSDNLIIIANDLGELIEQKLTDPNLTKIEGNNVKEVLENIVSRFKQPGIFRSCIFECWYRLTIWEDSSIKSIDLEKVELL